VYQKIAGNAGMRGMKCILLLVLFFCFSVSVLQVWDLNFLWHCLFWVLKRCSPEHFARVCCLQQVTYIFEYFCLVCVRKEVVERLHAIIKHLMYFCVDD
jgi:hypothetical protein